MRPEFKSLLEDLERAHVLVERQINERHQAFRFPKQNTGTDRESTRDHLTRYFWSLYCPEIPTEPNYQKRKQLVWSTLISITKQEFGPTPEVTFMDLASSGAEGGLRNLFLSIASILKDHLQHNQSEARVYDYWKSTPDRQKITDAQDYLRSFQHFLPIDQIDAGAVRIIANFRQVLHEHPKLMESKRIFRR